MHSANFSLEQSDRWKEIVPLMERAICILYEWPKFFKWLPNVHCLETSISLLAVSMGWFIFYAKNATIMADDLHSSSCSCNAALGLCQLSQAIKSDTDFLLKGVGDKDTNEDVKRVLEMVHTHLKFANVDLPSFLAVSFLFLSIYLQTPCSPVVGKAHRLF